MVTIEVTVIIRQLHNQNSTNNIDQTNHATIIHFNWANHMHECHSTIRNQEFITVTFSSASSVDSATEILVTSSSEIADRSSSATCCGLSKN